MQAAALVIERSMRVLLDAAARLIITPCAAGTWHVLN